MRENQTTTMRHIIELQNAALQDLSLDQSRSDEKLNLLHRRSRMWIFSITGAFGAILLVWILWGCPILHQINWCSSMRHSTAGQPH